MARLEEEQKRYLVRRNACFIAPQKIREEFFGLYKIKLEDAQISQYDPTTSNGDRDLGPELKELFYATRDQYIHDEEAVPIAHRAFRLNRLNELLKHPIAQESPRLEMAIHEQAAKERGGFYDKPKPPTTTGGNVLEAIRGFLTAPLREEAPEEGEPGEATEPAETTGETGDTSGESAGTGTGEAPVELGAAQ